MFNYHNIRDSGWTVFVITHLISLNFRHQVAECRQAAEADHGLALVGGQTLHFGQWLAGQNDLLTTQEVLELYIIWGLAGKRWIEIIKINVVWCYRETLFYLSVISYLGKPLRLILASSMAKVMWSMCSMPLAALLNATYIKIKTDRNKLCLLQLYQ